MKQHPLDWIALNKASVVADLEALDTAWNSAVSLFKQELRSAHAEGGTKARLVRAKIASLHHAYSQSLSKVLEVSHIHRQRMQAVAQQGCTLFNGPELESILNEVYLYERSIEEVDLMVLERITKLELERALS